MGFTWLHGYGGFNGSVSGNAFQLIMGSAPALGNTVVVAVCEYNGGAFNTLQTVKDSNLNSYIITPNSPSSNQDSTSGSVWLAYMLSAPANATTTINFTFLNNCNSVDVWVEMFSSTGGTPTFDTDITGFGSSAGFVINTPTIVPASAGCLLWAAAAVSGIIGPGQIYTPWTPSTVGPQLGNNEEYIVSSASGPTTVHIDAQDQQNWDSMAGSIKLVTTGAVQGYGASLITETHWLGGN